MFPGKMTCPYRPAASAIANAIPGLPCPAPWVHHDAHASSNARCDTRTCGKKKAKQMQRDGGGLRLDAIQGRRERVRFRLQACRRFQF